MHRPILLVFTTLIFILLLYTPHPSLAKTCWDVMTYGSSNTKEWREKLGLNNIRISCSNNPDNCLQKVTQLTDYHRIFLAIKRDSSLAPDYALEYSQLSLISPALYEIGFDDFYRLWIDQKINGGLEYDQKLLAKIIDNTKKYNPKLQFGITLYDTQLSTDAFDDNKLSPSLREKIDYIHFYNIFRKDGLDFAASVAIVKKKFPHAKIIGGIYAHDRIDQYRCTHSGSSLPCTNEQELDYFNRLVTVQAKLLQNCTISAIEFFPGYFGEEEKVVSGYGHCLDERKDICLQNTIKMRQSAFNILKTTKPTAPPTPTLTPTHKPSPTPTNIPTFTPTPTITSTPTSPPSALCQPCSGTANRSLGDANCDGVTDVLDFSIWQKEYFDGHQGVDINTNWSADFTCDSLVDVLDFSVWQKMFTY